jgi:hypothetical protein
MPKYSPRPLQATQFAQLAAKLGRVFVAVHRGGVLRRNFEQFLFIVGGDRHGALAVTRVFAAIDVFSSH